MLVTKRFLVLLLAGTALLALGVQYVWFYDLLMALLWLADYSAGRLLFRPVVGRSVATHLYQGQWFTVPLTVVNTARLPLRITLRDEVPAAFTRQGSELALVVRARDAGEGVYRVRPEQRGDFAFGSIHWRVEGPLGLAQYQGKTQFGQQMAVYPGNPGVQRFSLALRKRQWQELGFRRSRLKGEGVDLRELREFQTGDDIRKIDWKVTARAGYPVVREYEPERGHNIVILFDTGRLMENTVGGKSRLDTALSAALTLAYAAVTQGDRVGLLTFADEVINYVPPEKGREQLPRILQALYAVKPVGAESDYETAIRYLLSKQKKRGIVCLFTEVIDGDASQQLIRNISFLKRYHRVICVTLRDPALRKPFAAPVREVKDLYRQGASLQIQRERELAKGVLLRRGVAVVDADADRLSPELISRYLDLKGQALL
ncbi:MAG TPA: DUF58 domain-containing protein [Firmicutes bacterium]|nr:DUF58 domain-containing protein [Bacillota bacterium]HPT68278.1 DUF58 domain-containing protein [Bacillota bacterium]